MFKEKEEFYSILLKSFSESSKEVARQYELGVLYESIVKLNSKFWSDSHSKFLMAHGILSNQRRDCVFV